MTNSGNILLVANWDSDVGYAWWLMENFWVTISNAYKDKGKSCFLIYPKVSAIPESISTSDIEVLECDFNNRSFANIKKILKLIKSYNIRYIYLSDSASYSVFYILLKLWGVRKIVVHDHTPGERTAPAIWLKFLKYLIQRFPYFTADHFIAVTDYIYNRFIEVSRIPERKCSVAQNGIRPIDLDSIDENYAYQAFSIPVDRKIIVTTGRATYYKGIDFFIQCANELVNTQDFEHLHFLYCGDGPDIKDFHSLAIELNIGQNFTFAGKRDDIRKILPSCHIGFHAATGEVGYSLSILEYMSAGLVTIVPDNPSTSLATSDMSNGLLYKPRNIQSATKAIIRALDNRLALDIRKNAIQDINNNYNIDSTNKQLSSILQPIFT